MRDIPIWWLTSRATGIVGYLALAGSIVAGLASKARLGQRAASPLARLEWHKVLAITGLLAWAVGSGQFDDIEREGQRILIDDAEP